MEETIQVIEGLQGVILQEARAGERGHIYMHTKDTPVFDRVYPQAWLILEEAKKFQKDGDKAHIAYRKDFTRRFRQSYGSSVADWHYTTYRTYVGT